MNSEFQYTETDTLMDELRDAAFVMKILPILVIAISLLSCGGSPKQRKHEVNEDCVYVCSGAKARRYHSVNDCRGLSRCRGEILEMSKDEAENKGKTPCRMCVER